jgi:hypothetical protein
MAKVTVEITGSTPKVVEASTVKEVKEMFNKSNYIAKVNGDSADDDFELSDYEFVSLAENVKGA